MKKNQNKLYVIRKYVYAHNAKSALIKEKSQHADDIWIDENWKNQNMLNPNTGTIGFTDKK